MFLYNVSGTACTSCLETLWKVLPHNGLQVAIVSNVFMTCARIVL